MRKTIFGLFALMLTFLFSCSNDDLDIGKKDETVKFTVETSIQGEISTYASSNDGGFTNVSEDEYALRYILEVWTKEGKLAQRYCQIQTKFRSNPKKVVFSAELLSQTYDFVFWADFVDANPAVDQTADNFYNTNVGDKKLTDDDYKGLQDIRIKNYGVSNDARDAYFAVKTIDLTHSAAPQTSVELVRPFGKYRLIATDPPADLIVGDKVTIEYQALPCGFNALGDNITAYSPIPISCEAKVVEPESAVTVGGNTYNNVYLIAFDYVFASKAPAQTVSFNATVPGNSGAETGKREISGIPVERNKMTTVIGKFFTTDDITLIHPGENAKKIIEDLQPGEKATFAAGTYVLASIINVPDGVTIAGEKGAIVQADANLAASADRMFNVAGSDVTFDGLVIDLNNNVIKGIRSDGPVANTLVKNCTFYGAGSGSGSSATYVYLRNNDSPKIEDNIFENLTDKAVYLEKVSGNTIVSGNKITDGKTINGAIQVDNCEGTITISKNVITNVKTDPNSPTSSSPDKGSAINLYSDPATDKDPIINVSGNTITGCDRGIMVYKCNGQITIAGNNITGSALFDVGFDSLGNQAHVVNVNVTTSGSIHLIRDNWATSWWLTWTNLNIETDMGINIHNQ